MTLKQITEAIDAQVARLQKMRAIVATLLPSDSNPVVTSPTPISVTPSAAIIPPLAAADPAQEPTAEPALSAARKPRLRPSRRPRVTHTANRTRELSPTALGGVIPHGPIAISAADAVRSRHIVEATSPARQVGTTSPSGHSLDDLVRQLTHRSGPGFPDRSVTD